MRFSKKGENVLLPKLQLAHAPNCESDLLKKPRFASISSLQLPNMIRDSILFIVLKYFTSKLIKTFFDIRLPTSLLKKPIWHHSLFPIKNGCLKGLIPIRDSAVWKTSLIFVLCAVLSVLQGNSIYTPRPLTACPCVEYMS